MIINFASQCAEDIYNGVESKRSRGLPVHLHSKCQRLLDQINAVAVISTLRVPPSNRLEKLKGRLAPHWSLRVNDQWRIVFKWEDGNAFDVDVLDYH